MSTFLFKIQELVFDMKEKLTEKQFLEFNNNLLKSFEENETMIESLKKKELYKKYYQFEYEKMNSIREDFFTEDIYNCLSQKFLFTSFENMSFFEKFSILPLFNNWVENNWKQKKAKFYQTTHISKEDYMSILDIICYENRNFTNPDKDYHSFYDDLHSDTFYEIRKGNELHDNSIFVYMNLIECDSLDCGVLSFLSKYDKKIYRIEIIDIQFNTES